MSPDHPYFGYLAVGLPLIAVVANLALANRLRSETSYVKEASALTRTTIAVIAIAFLIGVLIALSPFFAFFQFGFLIICAPVVVFTTFQLMKLFQNGIERGRVAFALVAWLAVLVFWVIYFAG